MSASNKGIPLWLWPLLLAVFLTVAYKIGDGYVMGQLIVSQDKLISTLVYLTLGALTGLTINFILCQTPFGRLVDKSFKSIRGVSKRAHVTAIISGVFSAMATGIYLWSLRTLDPSLVIPLTSLTILYIAFVEALRGRIKFGYVLPSVVLVLLGVGIASFNEAANWAVTGGTLITMLLIYNVVNAVSELASKEGVDASDAVSYGFWRFFWLTVAAVIIAIGTSIALGQFTVFLSLLFASLNAIPFIVLVMLVVFFANAWANRGLALSNATTKNLVMTGQVILSVFAMVLVTALFPGIFPAAPATLLQWVLRGVGVALLMWGVIRLRK